MIQAAGTQATTAPEFAVLAQGLSRYTFIKRYRSRRVRPMRIRATERLPVNTGVDQPPGQQGGKDNGYYTRHLDLR
jgi:hypothetical protein